MVPKERLEALVLGGGYGRGEGGVLHSDQGDQPYNDIEYFLFLNGSPRVNERRYGKALQTLGHDLSAMCGIEVEFKITSSLAFRSSPVSMFYYDLYTGHKTVLGTEGVFAGCEHHAEAHAIPLHEVTRLLFNRASGLHFASLRLMAKEFGPEDADFCARNLAKAWLAMGDAVLAAAGHYHWSCRERHERLQILAGEQPQGLVPDLLSRHREGVRFKLRPAKTLLEREDLETRLAETTELMWRTWRLVEEKRLGVELPDALAYATLDHDLCPQHSWVKNMVLSFQHLGGGALGWPGPLRYPRERLLRALSLLLWVQTDQKLSDKLLTSLLAEDGAKVRSDTYLRLWQRFN